MRREGRGERGEGRGERERGRDDYLFRNLARDLVSTHRVLR